MDQANQYAGRSWPQTTAADICDASHGFAPNWTDACGETTWAVYYTGQVSLPLVGAYCFGVNSAATQGLACGSLILNGDGSSPLVTTQEGNAGVHHRSGGLIGEDRNLLSAVERGVIAVWLRGGPGPGPRLGTYGLDVIWCYDATGKNCDPQALSTPNQLAPGMLRNH